MSRFARRVCAALVASTVLIFCITANAGSQPGPWNLTVITTFGQAPDASEPLSGVVFDNNGAAYGTSIVGGVYNKGVVYQLMPPVKQGDPWTKTVIYSFTGGNDGATPLRRLAIDQNGAVYGVTVSGGQYNLGTVWELAPQGGSWVETILHTFTGASDGADPHAGVTLGASGNIYGSAYSGGDSSCDGGCGTIFELTPAGGGAWTFSTIYAFKGPQQGLSPFGSVIEDAQGNLYGTTYFGGKHYGNVFQLVPPANTGDPWTENVLWTFAFQPGEGIYPWGELLLDGDGSLYGVTYAGGSTHCNLSTLGCGIIFQLTPPSVNGGAWTETVLHVFSTLDGGAPVGPLVQGAGGALYAGTYGGGPFDLGVVFQLRHPTTQGGKWNLVRLWVFVPAMEAASIQGPLVFHNGALFGVTEGNPDITGEVFQLVPPS